MIAPPAAVPGAARVALAAGAAALVLAPPHSNLAWAFGGLRSAPLPTLAGGAAVAAAALAPLAGRRRFELALGLLLALVLAFPLRERAHLVGDLGLRHRLLETLVTPGARLLSTGALARVLHSQPLDALVAVGVPASLARAGLPVATAVAVVGAGLFALFAAGLRRVFADVPPPLGPVLAGTAACSGLLLLYAGYADGLPLALAFAVWWWSLLDAPLRSPRRAWLAAGAWLALASSHRAGWVMLAPMAWRAVAPTRPGDAPGVRAWLAGATLAAAAAAGALAVLVGGADLSQDLGDLAGALRGAGRARWVSPADLLNLTALTLPLALLAPWVAGRRAVSAFARTPSAGLFAAAWLPLTPLLLVYPVAAHGLGAHRDWDLAALPGLLASLAGARVLSHGDAGRVRAALPAVVAVLAVLAGGWLAVNADPALGLARAHALVEGPGALRGEPANQVHVLLAYRAAESGDYAESARRFELAAAALPNPRHELLAAQAWLAAGDRRRAHGAYARALGHAPLPPDVQRTADIVRGLLGLPPAVAPPVPPQPRRAP